MSKNKLSNDLDTFNNPNVEADYIIRIKIPENIFWLLVFLKGAVSLLKLTVLDFFIFSFCFAIFFKNTN